MLLRPLRLYVYLLPPALALAFYIEIGTRWSPVKIVPLVFCAGALLRTHLQPELRRIWRMPLWVIYFLLIVVVSSFINYPRLPGYSGKVYGILQSPQLRTFVQVVAYLTTGCYFLIAKFCLRTPEQTKRLIDVYVLTTTILCLYGVYQFVAYYTGLPYRQTLYAPGQEHFGLINFADQIIPRMSSLAGEPKDFGMVLFPALALLLHLRFYPSNVFTGKFYSTANTGLHGVIFLLTFSASVYLVFLVFIPLALLSYRKFTVRPRVNPTRILISFAIIGLLYLGVSRQVWKLPEPEMLLYKMSVGKLLTQKRTEHYVLDLLKQRPDLALSGMGPGNYNYYLIANLGYGSAQWLKILRSGIMTLLADVGLFGCLIIFFGIIYTMRTHLRLDRTIHDRRTREISSALYMMTLAALSLLLSLNSIAYVWLFLGGMYAFDRSLQRRRLAVGSDERADVQVVGKEA